MPWCCHKPRKQDLSVNLNIWHQGQKSTHCFSFLTHGNPWQACPTFFFFAHTNGLNLINVRKRGPHRMRHRSSVERDHGNGRMTSNIRIFRDCAHQHVRCQSVHGRHSSIHASHHWCDAAQYRRACRHFSHSVATANDQSMPCSWAWVRVTVILQTPTAHAASWSD